VLLALVVAGIVATDRYSSAIIPISLWSKLGAVEFPFKVTVLLSILVALATCVFYFARKSNDSFVLLIAIAVVALQTNGIKLGAFDLITVYPLFIIFFLLAESLKRPSFQIVLPGLVFFGVLLGLLDIPYFTNLNIYPPARFIINFISMMKGMLVAFVFVNLIRTQYHLEFTIRAVVVVAVISALIGIAQIVIGASTGVLLQFTSEEGAWKPNFLGLPLRATGLTTWGSWLSDFLVFALPFMLFGLAGADRFSVRAGYALAIAIALTAIFLTFTYAAYFAVVLIFFLFPFVYWPRRALHFLIGLLMAGAVAYATGGLEWAVEHGLAKVTSSTGMIERRSYLLSTLNELVRDPWAGSGFYAEEEFSENFYRKRVHNTGLQAWADLGLPGLLVFLTMMLTVLTQTWLLAFSAPGESDRQRFKALGLGVSAMILCMFAEPNLTHPITWYYLGLCQAAVLVYCSTRYPGPASRPSNVHRVSTEGDPAGVGIRATGTRGEGFGAGIL